MQPSTLLLVLVCPSFACFSAQAVGVGHCSPDLPAVFCRILSINLAFLPRPLAPGLHTKLDAVKGSHNTPCQPKTLISLLSCFSLVLQPKLSGLDTVHLTCLLSSWSTLKFEPEPAVMRGVMGEVYTKLPLFDDKVCGP